MKPKRLLTAAVTCAFAFIATFGTYAMSSEGTAQEISAASYDSNELALYADQIAALVNSERSAYGIAPVALSPKLSQAANVRAHELIQLFEHTRPDGRSCFTAISDMNIRYSYAAENIAYGQKDPQSVMNAWMNSAGHRANILDPNMEYIGVGAVYENGIYYWSQFFAASAELSDDNAAAPETPAETTVTDVTEDKPAETTAPDETENDRPDSSAVPSETQKPEDTKAPENSEKPQETVPSETTIPAGSQTACKPCETTCKVNPDGTISCTPSTPCETECKVNSDGTISCTPSTPCETECKVNSDGTISCTPSTPCETECKVNANGTISCTPSTPCETECKVNSDGTISCTPSASCGNDKTSSGCPLLSGTQGNNLFEWLIPKIMNSGSCNSSTSNSGSCSKNNSYVYDAQDNSSSSCNSSSGSCWGNSSNSYGSDSGSCWGNSSNAYSSDSGSCWGNSSNAYGSDSGSCWGN